MLLNAVSNTLTGFSPSWQDPSNSLSLGLCLTSFYISCLCWDWHSIDFSINACRKDQWNHGLFRNEALNTNLLCSYRAQVCCPGRFYTLTTRHPLTMTSFNTEISAAPGYLSYPYLRTCNPTKVLTHFIFPSHMVWAWVTSKEQRIVSYSSGGWKINTKKRYLARDVLLDHSLMEGRGKDREKGGGG